MSPEPDLSGLPPADKAAHRRGPRPRLRTGRQTGLSIEDLSMPGLRQKQAPGREASVLPGWTTCERAARLQADSCCALAEQESDEAGPARLMLVPCGSLDQAERGPCFVRESSSDRIGGGYESDDASCGRGSAHRARQLARATPRGRRTRKTRSKRSYRVLLASPTRRYATAPAGQWRPTAPVTGRRGSNYREAPRVERVVARA